MQQIFLGLGAVAKKSYVDDVFSTYLYTGNASTQTINNGIDLSGEGGLVWAKKRGSAGNYVLTDTVRGNTKRIECSSTDAEATGNNVLNSFNSNGFTLGYDGAFNQSGEPFSSWTFRKAPGFFDIVSWTGNATAGRQISHNLECQPGRIIIKCTSKTGDWLVNDYAADQNGNIWGKLNEDGQFLGAGQYTGSTGPTSTHFTLGSANEVNENGETFVAYIFAGADRTGNASVEFQGEDGYLKFKDTSDWEFTGQFSLEYWVYMTSNSAESPTITWGSGTYRALFWSPGSSNWRFQWPTGNSNVNMGGTAPTNTWKHHVLTRDSSNVLRFFIDGELIYNTTESDNLGASEQLFLGYKANNPSNGLKNGKLSNVRIVKGSIPTTYQTSSTTNGASIFTSPTAPLTKTSQGATSGDVKLICCNDIGASQATYISDSPGNTNYGAIGARGSTESPFSATTDASAVFGGDEDKSVIRTGQYMGSGSATAGNTVDVGFEPSYIMIKRSGGDGNWTLLDCMRGIVTGGTDMMLKPNSIDAETTSNDYIELTPRGFRLTASYNQVNANENGYVYICVRRPDGYVGKPPELGTDVLQLDWGDGYTWIPNFPCGFPVDFAFIKKWQDPSDWETSARLIQGKYLKLNTITPESSGAGYTFDSNAGFDKSGKDANWLGYMFKRHAGFDLVTWTGDGVSGRQIPHSLSKTPEMMWVKKRSSGNRNWAAYHKGLNGGSSPEDYFLVLNDPDAESNNAGRWNDTAPTSSHFTIGNNEDVNSDTETYIAMLFASVNGISKVGSFVGSDSNQTITLGFQPRFVIVKAYTAAHSWLVLDNKRGWATSSGNNSNYLFLDSTAAQGSIDIGYTTSTGFVAIGNNGNINDAGVSYIYYAHA